MSFPSPGDLPDPGIEPRYPPLQADSLPAEPPEKTKTLSLIISTNLSNLAAFFFLLLLSKDGLRLHLSLGLIDFLHREAYGEGTCITQSLFL